MNLSSLLRGPEGKTFECKRDFSSPDGVIKTLVAFANTSGGVLLIGVEDKTHQVIGIDDVLTAEERLASLIDDTIKPKLIPSIDILSWRNKQLLCVTVAPSPCRPHYYQKLGPQEGILIRIGSTNRRADPALVEELRRFGRPASFDDQPIPDARPDAIDVHAATPLFHPKRKLTPQSLQSLRITTPYQRRIVPTIGGMLLFGKHRLSRFPDAWIQAGRFAGTDRRRVLDSTEIRTYLPIAVADAIAFIHKHSTREAVIGKVKRADRWTIPSVAIREAVINAVVHADYSQHGAPIRIALFDDRLEIENPGMLPFGLTLDDIRRGVSKLRNRVIGRVFQELGLIEQWGSGIQRMTAACRDEGLADPKLEELGTHFRVTLSAIQTRTPYLDPRDKSILTMLKNAGDDGLGTAEIARRLSRSPRATRMRLAVLVGRGHVVEIGSGATDPRRRYCLSTTAPAL